MNGSEFGSERGATLSNSTVIAPSGHGNYENKGRECKVKEWKEEEQYQRKGATKTRLYDIRSSPCHMAEQVWETEDCDSGE